MGCFTCGIPLCFIITEATMHPHSRSHCQGEKDVRLELSSVVSFHPFEKLMKIVKIYAKICKSLLKEKKWNRIYVIW